MKLHFQLCIDIVYINNRRCCVYHRNLWYLQIDLQIPKVCLVFHKDFNNTKHQTQAVETPGMTFFDSWLLHNYPFGFWSLPNCCNLLGNAAFLSPKKAFAPCDRVPAFTGICYAGQVVPQLEWLLVIKWEGTMRLDDVKWSVFMRVLEAFLMHKSSR